MAWDKTLPGDSEKIRNLGVVIRPNWDAIEEGDDVGVSNMLKMRSIQLGNRTVLASNNDPQTSAGTHYIYSKEDGSGTQEAFLKDSAGNVVQLTSSGKVGGTSVGFEMDSFSFDGTRVYDEKNVIVAWGFVLANALSYGDGVNSVTHDSQGKYTLNFTAGRLTTANYSVVAIAAGKANASWGESLVKTTAAFAIETRSSSGLANSEFFFMVVGGQ